MCHGIRWCNLSLPCNESTQTTSVQSKPVVKNKTRFHSLFAEIKPFLSRFLLLKVIVVVFLVLQKNAFLREVLTGIYYVFDIDTLFHFFLVENKKIQSTAIQEQSKHQKSVSKAWQWIIIMIKQTKLFQILNTTTVCRCVPDAIYSFCYFTIHHGFIWKKGDEIEFKKCGSTTKPL